jgi:hypothetical protein
VTLHCAPLLLSLVVMACGSRLRVPEAFPSHDAALDSLAIATAIQHGLRTAHPRGDVRLACVSIGNADPEPGQLARIRSEGVTLRPGSACHAEQPSGRGTGRSLVVERTGGELRGISVNVNRRAVVEKGILTFQVSYYQHYLSAAEWRCTARRRGKKWVLDVCQLESIS